VALERELAGSDGIAKNIIEKANSGHHPHQHQTASVIIVSRRGILSLITQCSLWRAFSRIKKWRGSSSTLIYVPTPVRKRSGEPSKTPVLSLENAACPLR